VKSVTVDVFPDSSPSTFVYYDDDGATYDCEKAGYFKQEIGLRRIATGSSLVLGPRTGEYSPALKWYTFKIHGPGLRLTYRRCQTSPATERPSGAGEL